MMCDLSKLSREELELGFSKRVKQFKEEGLSCVTLEYGEYERLHDYASIGLEISKLDQDDRQHLTLSELIEMMERDS